MAIAAIRHNNPGNVSLPIRGWKGGGTIVGIKGQSGYAHFPDMKTGAEALQHRLSTRIEDGYNTIRKLNPIYAEDTNWKDGVSRASGIGLDEPLTSANVGRLTSGIVRQETGLDASRFGFDASGNTDPQIGGAGGMIEYGATGGGGFATDGGGYFDVGPNGEKLGIDGKPLTVFNINEKLRTAADLNGDGETTIGELKQFMQTEEGKSAAKQAGEQAGKIDAANKGTARTVPQAILEAANQESKTTESAFKGLSSTIAGASDATNKTNTGLQSGLFNWGGNLVLQIAVFLVAMIFILVGLYMFVGKNTDISLPFVKSA